MAHSNNVRSATYECQFNNQLHYKEFITLFNALLLMNTKNCIKVPIKLNKECQSNRESSNFKSNFRFLPDAFETIDN